jgi:superfamily I DNA/RNA helicase
VQSSKGLEFRSVIFIGLVQIKTFQTQAAQNMKLLYVGMTRAKERLMITASAKNEFTEKLVSMTGAHCAVA